MLKIVFSFILKNAIAAEYSGSKVRTFQFYSWNISTLFSEFWMLS